MWTFPCQQPLHTSRGCHRRRRTNNASTSLNSYALSSFFGNNRSNSWQLFHRRYITEEDILATEEGLAPLHSKAQIIKEDSSNILMLQWFRQVEEEARALDRSEVFREAALQWTSTAANRKIPIKEAARQWSAILHVYSRTSLFTNIRGLPWESARASRCCETIEVLHSGSRKDLAESVQRQTASSPQDVAAVTEKEIHTSLPESLLDRRKSSKVIPEWDILSAITLQTLKLNWPQH